MIRSFCAVSSLSSASLFFYHLLLVDSNEIYCYGKHAVGPVGGGGRQTTLPGWQRDSPLCPVGVGVGIVSVSGSFINLYC